MNDLESQLATAQELVALAKQQGVDLSSTCHDWSFFNDGRIIWFWRKDGKIHYSLQGPVESLPDRYKPAADHFNGI
jgi:hypothetical protein